MNLTSHRRAVMSAHSRPAPSQRRCSWRSPAPSLHYLWRTCLTDRSCTSCGPHPGSTGGTRGISLSGAQDLPDGSRNDLRCVSSSISSASTLADLRMSYGDHGGATGWSRTRELRHGGDFTMMNNARLNVGLQGAALRSVQPSGRSLMRSSASRGCAIGCRCRLPSIPMSGACSCGCAP